MRTHATPKSERKAATKIPTPPPAHNRNASLSPTRGVLDFSSATLGDAVPPGQGVRLDSSLSRDLERHLHWDFSQVRVHSGDEASSYAAHFGAPAYAVGNHIVLGDEKQRKGTNNGELLRHEAIHTMQQSGRDGNWTARPLSVSRAGDSVEREASALARVGLPDGRLVAPLEPCVARANPISPQIVYDAKDPKLKEWRQKIVNQALNPPAPLDPAFKEKSPTANRMIAEQCFYLIRWKASRQELPAGTTEEFYYDRLTKLLSVPRSLADKSRLQKHASALYYQWLIPAPGSTKEEKLTASLKKNRLPSGEEVEVRKYERWTKYARIAGRFIIFLYRSKGEKQWYKRAHVYGEIQLVPARKTGPGAAEDEKTIKQITETIQEIEDVAAGTPASGVTFDLEVRTRQRTGVATFKVNSSDWIDAGNPWGPAKTMVEELFHNIGLQDVYDYIEKHAQNANYPISVRLNLFHAQLTKYGSKDPKWRPDLPSITNKRADTPSDFDYCQVIAPTRPQLQQCLSERGVPPAP